MWRFKHLLSLQIAFATGLPLIILFVVGILVVAPQMRMQVEARHQAVAIAMAGQVEGYLLGASRELDTLVRLLVSEPRDQWNRLLDTFVGDLNIFADILVVDEHGLSQYAGLPTALRRSRENYIGIDLTRRQFYTEMVTTGLPTWSDTYLSASNGQLTVAYSIPVGKLGLTGEIELTRLSQLIERISGRDQMEVMIVDGTGALVAHALPELTGQQLNLSHLPVVSSGLRGQAGIQDFEFQGQQLVGMSVAVRDVGWIALVAQPYSVAYQAVTLAGRVVLIALFLGLLISVAGGLVLANWVASHIDLFANNVRKISTGIYGMLWPGSRVLEFNTLGEHLHVMEESIQTREKELQAHRQHLEELVEERTRELADAQEELIRSEKLSTLGKLTATVSHELRNPLFVIQNSMHILRRKLEGESNPHEELLERVERNIQRCSHIIEEMLEFTRLQPQEMHPLIFDDWLRRMLKDYAFPEGVEIITKFSAREGIVLMAADKFYRVVVNLIDNACQAMIESPSQGDSGKTLTIATELNAETLQLTISDTGPGLEESVHDKIFEPLFSTRSFGVGLGLPIVKQIIEGHHGTVQLSNRADGPGAVVRLTLPITALESNDGKS